MYPTAVMHTDGNDRVITSNDAFLAAKELVFDGSSAKGAIEAAATLETALAGDNNDLVYTAKTSGVGGNAISIEYIDPGEVDAELAVDVEENAIIVYLETDGDGLIVSTADDIKTAIAGEAAADALVGTADAGGNDGSGVVVAMSATNLADGTNGAMPIFSVEGDVLVSLFAVCSEALTGASATIEVGTEADSDALIEQTTAADIDAGEVWVDSAPLTVEDLPDKKILTGGKDIQALIETAAVDGGAIKIYALWRPLSEGANLVAV